MLKNAQLATQAKDCTKISFEALIFRQPVLILPSQKAEMLTPVWLLVSFFGFCLNKMDVFRLQDEKPELYL